MHTPASPSVSPRLAAKLAWMHAPVRLTPGHLPWAVRKLLEFALHAFLCRFEQSLLALLELHRQGKLEPWPEEEPAAAQLPRARTYRLKLTPAAPTRSTGAKPVRAVAAAAPGGRADASAMAVAAKIGTLADERVFELALPRRPRARSRARMLVGGGGLLVDRCRLATLCSAAALRWKNCV